MSAPVAPSEVPVDAPVDRPQPRRVTDRPTRVDRWFDRLTLACGLIVLLLLVLVGVYLLQRSRQALDVTGVWNFLTTETWRTDVDPPEIGVLGMLVGTVLVAFIAVALAIPLGTVSALFITEYASPGARKYLTALVDLLAAIPSLIFGLWGFLALSGDLASLAQWIGDNFGWIPIFAIDDDANLTNSMFIAGVVVSLMVVPIIASVAREVFAQSPPGEKEAALALGSTRWGMIRTVVLPYGRGGIIGGSMLGLGRALGETIAVSLLLPQVPEITARILENGGATVSGFIVLRAGADEFTTSGLMAAGLVLFIVTLVTNSLASVVVARSRSGVGVEL
jgi:phosphate transport system permease protein